MLFVLVVAALSVEDVGVDSLTVACLELDCVAAALLDGVVATECDVDGTAVAVGVTRIDVDGERAWVPEAVDAADDEAVCGEECVTVSAAVSDMDCTADTEADMA
jgi:hypothetical protein